MSLKIGLSSGRAVTLVTIFLHFPDGERRLIIIIMCNDLISNDLMHPGIQAKGIFLTRVIFIKVLIVICLYMFKNFIHL